VEASTSKCRSSRFQAALEISPTKASPIPAGSRQKQQREMNRIEDQRAEIAAENRRREAAMNPPQPSPKPQAVRVLKRGLFAGVRVPAGALLPVWPPAPPGWLTAADALELVQGLLAEPATPAELEEFLALQEEGRSEP
jgi:hypothetical protein